MQLVDEQFDKHQYDQSMMIVKLAEGPDRALEIRIKRNNVNFEANGWQIALSQKKVLDNTLTCLILANMFQIMCCLCFKTCNATFDLVCMQYPLKLTT